MKNKSKDIKYCSINKDNLNKDVSLVKDNVKLFHHFITERYKVHLRKDIEKLPYPWTDDEILKNYKFCNIRREHDRNSKWLIENISTNDKLSLNEKIYKTLIFRLYNTIETAELIDLKNLDLCDIDDALDAIRNKVKEDNDFRFYTNAYKTGGTKRGLCNSCNLSHSKYAKSIAPLFFVTTYLMNSHCAESLLNSENQEEVYNKLLSIKGCGRFIAYQLYVDLTYIPEFPFSENEFVIAGPGCIYGMEILKGDKNWDNYTPEELLFILRDKLPKLFERMNLEWNPKELFSDLPEEDRYINIMSLENCFCEFQKYYCKLNNIGKSPRGIKFINYFK